MTRGRKKDLTIPPTRALTQQRDYRARKAHYVSELEERCRQMEEDNNKLRQEIDSLKAGLPITTIYSPQMVCTLHIFRGRNIDVVRRWQHPPS